MRGYGQIAHTLATHTCAEIIQRIAYLALSLGLSLGSNMSTYMLLPIGLALTVSDKLFALGFLR